MHNTKKRDIKCDKIFVYGTLQHGQSRNYILRGLKYENAILFNYKKVEPPSLGFPFIISKNNSKVKGEIYYSVGKDLIDQLDMIEGEGKLYHRILVKVKLEDGSEKEACTYYPSKVLINNYI
ncbi:MAG: gamma-glutamylcyclotransferase family protein [Promethearchaeota archaeon]